MKNAQQQSQRNEKVMEQLQGPLLQLPFAVFEQFIIELLQQSGYASVHMMGRKHKRGRTKAGGHELRTYTQTDFASSLTLTQIKQYQRVVSRRFVDELRGTMLRVGAEQGLLITTSTFSRVAYKAATVSDVAPIRLIDGEELTQLMVGHRLGVYPAQKGIFALAAAYFDNLQKRCRCTGGALRPRELPQARAHTAQKNANEKASANQADMLWRTHALIGINSLWLLELIPPGIERGNLALLLGVAAFGALLPDLDARESKIKHLSVARIKPFYLPALAIHRQLGHRGFSHSLSALALVAVAAAGFNGALYYSNLPLASFWAWQASAALVLGYASHLAADASTKSGIPLLYVPWLYPHKKRYHLLPPSLRFTTGSEAEEVLFPLLALLILLLLLNHLVPQNGEVNPFEVM